MRNSAKCSIRSNSVNRCPVLKEPHRGRGRINYTQSTLKHLMKNCCLFHHFDGGRTTLLFMCLNNDTSADMVLYSSCFVLCLSFRYTYTPPQFLPKTSSECGVILVIISQLYESPLSLLFSHMLHLKDTGFTSVLQYI